MKYQEIAFNITPYNEDAADLVAALSAEAGLESFIPADNGLKGYARDIEFSREALDGILDSFPMPGVAVTYTVREAEDKNWNEDWEQHGFRPILIAGKVLIHSEAHTDLPHAEYDICINPRQAFGTGSHQTTEMIITRLLGMDLNGKKVLDAGCGTGILGIFSVMRGAQSVLGYDIDDWSVRNTEDNVRLNGISAMRVVEGDASVLTGSTERYDLILANINCNILLQDMPAFTEVLAQDGTLILSGFFTEDIPALCKKAAQLGLQLVDTTEKDNWASLLFRR